MPRCWHPPGRRRSGRHLPPPAPVGSWRVGRGRFSTSGRQSAIASARMAQMRGSADWAPLRRSASCRCCSPFPAWRSRRRCSVKASVPRWWQSPPASSCVSLEPNVSRDGANTTRRRQAAAFHHARPFSIVRIPPAQKPVDSDDTEGAQSLVQRLTIRGPPEDRTARDCRYHFIDEGSDD